MADTMAIVLRLEGRKLGPVGKAAFNLVESGNATALVPAMVCAEILYLSERHRIGIGLVDVSDYMNRYATCQQFSLDLSVIWAAAQITDVPDLHDRLIAGTARFLNVPLLTNDPVIQTSVWVSTIW